MLTFPQYIRSLREKCGFSQDFLAKKLGLSRPTFVLIEQGGRDLTIPEAEKLAGFFGLSLGEFLLKEGQHETEVIVKKQTPLLRVVVPENKINKFKEILLYILEKVGAKPNIGETALYKLLYFIDFDFFEKYGEKLTGATYLKNHYGPTPIEFKKIISILESKGEVETVKSKYFQYDQTKYLPRRAANLDVINGTEKNHIDEVLDRLSNKTAKELSEYSHGDIPWQATPEKETIDYTLVFQRALPYAQSDHEEEFLNTATQDTFLGFPPLSKKEYDHYMSLPEKDA
ncbi:MAG: type II toxin-antitoxin system antitoxin SocA domain-containing protein [Candidatus Gracilibacteria bacterium]